jgi:hypothetical protein
MNRRCLGQAFTLALALSLVAVSTVDAQTQPQGPTSLKPAKKTEAKLVLEPRAMDLLKAMSARLAAAKTLSFTATVGYEYPSALGPPIVYSSRYDVVLQRPDKLKIVMPGDGPASEFYYDGKSMMAFAPVENLVAIADGPPTIDAALQKAFEAADIYYPFTDLIISDPFAALSVKGKLAFYIGPSGVIGGIKTDMIAWADDDIFLQVWIGVDDKLPRRVRAIYRNDPARLRHEMELSNWQLDQPVPPDAFASPKALAAARIAFDHPASAARLPSGAKPLTQAKPAKASAKP